MNLKDITGYYPISNIEKSDIWKNAIFVFDTSFLLNLYRYEKKIQDDIFLVLSKIQGKIWITHYTAIEYLRNRASVRLEQIRIYDEAASLSEKILIDFQNGTKNYKTRHTYIDTDEFESAIRGATEKFKDYLTKTKENDPSLLPEDEILKKLQDYIQDNVFEHTEIRDNFSEFSTEAEARFSLKTPPGYSDAKKKETFILDGLEIPLKYGDLIIWKEIIALSSNLKKNVIFVTDDQKEDWWWKISGKTQGPRPELTREFLKNTGKNFLAYSSSSFLSTASAELSVKIDDQTTSRIQDINRASLLELRQYFEKNPSESFNDLAIKLWKRAQAVKLVCEHLALRLLDESENPMSALGGLDALLIRDGELDIYGLEVIITDHLTPSKIDEIASGFRNIISNPQHYGIQKGIIAIILQEDENSEILRAELIQKLFSKYYKNKDIEVVLISSSPSGEELKII